MSNDTPTPNLLESPPPLKELSVLDVLDRIQRALELLAHDQDRVHAKLDKILMKVDDLDETVDDILPKIEEIQQGLEDMVFDDAYPGSGEED